MSNATQTNRNVNASMEITILTNPTTEEMGPVFSRPFDSESAAIRKAKKAGSTKIAFHPEDYYFEARWYVGLPG